MDKYNIQDDVRNLLLVAPSLFLPVSSNFSPIYMRALIREIDAQTAKNSIVDKLLHISDRDLGRAKYMGRVITLAWPGFKAA